MKKKIETLTLVLRGSLHTFVLTVMGLLDQIFHLIQLPFGLVWFCNGGKREYKMSILWVTNVRKRHSPVMREVLYIVQSRVSCFTIF